VIPTVPPTANALFLQPITAYCSASRTAGRAWLNRHRILISDVFQARTLHGRLPQPSKMTRCDLSYRSDAISDTVPSRGEHALRSRIALGTGRIWRPAACFTRHDRALLPGALHVCHSCHGRPRMLSASQALPSGVSLPMCSCMFERRTRRRHRNGRRNSRFSGF
jgi:hypothetical protein